LPDRILASHRYGKLTDRAVPPAHAARPDPFDHPDWLYEIKHDGFRALAINEGQRLPTRLPTRARPGTLGPAHHGNRPHVRAHNATLDGEFVCLDADGCSNFCELLFRRDWPFFYAFDVLSVEGEDVQNGHSLSGSGSCAG